MNHSLLICHVMIKAVFYCNTTKIVNFCPNFGFPGKKKKRIALVMTFLSDDSTWIEEHYLKLNVIQLKSQRFSKWLFFFCHFAFGVDVNQWNWACRWDCWSFLISYFSLEECACHWLSPGNNQQGVGGWPARDTSSNSEKKRQANCDKPLNILKKKSL